MESQQFDRIVKGLGQPASRCTAAKAVAAGGPGVALTRMMAKDAAAQGCQRKGRVCRHNGQCCSGECHRDRCRRDREREGD